MPTRIGVVGAGAHSARQHGPALQQCATERRAIELAGVCDLDPERAERYAAEFGFDAIYTDMDRMLEVEDFDAVVAITPTDATRDVAGDLLRRGMPTLVEKPPGLTADETAELRDIAAEHGTPHMISFNRRFNPAVARAREFLDGRESPRRVVARLYRVGRLETNHVFSTGIHAVDLVCSIVSTPERVLSQRWRSREAGGESCEALLACADGEAATVLVTPDSGRHEETYELVGPHYTVTINVADPRVEAFVAGDRRFVWEVPDDAPAYERVGALAETRAFLDAVAGERPFAPDLAEALTSMRTATAVSEGGRHTL